MKSKKTKHGISRIIYLLFSVLLLTSCVKKDDGYNAGQQTVINNLTDKHWERKFHDSFEGQESETHEIWIFEKNGKGSHKTITTYEQGKEEECIAYFNWSFVTPSFNIIYMDHPRYWKIDKLTAKKLCIYQSFNNPAIVSQDSEYQEYDAN